MNDKVIFQGNPYIKLENVKEECSYCNWYGYKMKNLKTGEIEIISQNLVQSEGCSLWNLEYERKTLLEKIDAVDQKIEKLNHIFEGVNS